MDHGKIEKGKDYNIFSSHIPAKTKTPLEPVQGGKSEKKRRRKQQQNQKEYIWLTSHHEGSQFCRTGTP